MHVAVMPKHMEKCNGVPFCVYNAVNADTPSGTKRGLFHLFIYECVVFDVE